MCVWYVCICIEYLVQKIAFCKGQGTEVVMDARDGISQAHHERGRDHFFGNIPTHFRVIYRFHI